MILLPKKQFSKHYQKLNLKIQNKVDKVLDLFMLNPIAPELNNHQLSWKLSYLRSIDVSWDYRIWIHQLDEKTYEIVEIIDIGTHAQLYG